MKINKPTLIISFLFVAALIFGIINKIKVSTLKNKVKELSEIVSTNDSIQQQKRAIQTIDSLLLSGNYQQALSAYNNSITADEMTKFRIAIAKQLVTLKKNTVTTKKDSSLTKPNLKNTVISSNFRNNSYDSLNFVLDKTKTQLQVLKNQLKRKSFGEYLTFSNAKKHKLHYVGQVKNKKANGTGIAMYDTGGRYEGQWKDNLRNGFGIFFWIDGQRYEGDYKNDFRHGNGTYYWPNGEKYVGEWLNDQRHGKGVFYDKDGKIVTSGIWKNDKLDSEFKKETK